MMNNSVEVDNLVVNRGDKAVLRGLTVGIARGSITGLLGPSGCGKTTLIRSIVGAQIITSGSVQVLGEAAGSAANRTRVGYMTQSSSVYADLSVRQNLEYFADLCGERAAQVDEVLDAVDLRREANQLTGNLSGGQRTRVSLAATLISRPEVYLLDEPTVGLDPVLRRDLWQLFAELAADSKTILVSSHVMDEAGRCDNIALMRQGELLAVTTPAGLRSQAGTEDLEQAFLTLAERSSS